MFLSSHSIYPAPKQGQPLSILEETQLEAVCPPRLVQKSKTKKESAISYIIINFQHSGILASGLYLANDVSTKRFLPPSLMPR